ncbi:hypothetical protein QYF61_000527 [Mycteria americana]|uniref:Uncharacterized protein n=1 Tax=Mycteria americana TaxID=33587 RepID=A0AAN7NNE9_MYCAM|nr:hypothetical protein QYF61_000527 [Mycteria americana]
MARRRGIKGKLGLTNLIVFHDNMTGFLDNGRAVTYLDFIKTFKPVFYNILVSLFQCYDLDGWTSRWVNGWMFADVTGLGGPVNTYKVRASIHRDMDRLKERANGNLMRFIKDKCQPLLQRRKRPLQ